MMRIINRIILVFFSAALLSCIGVIARGEAPKQSHNFGIVCNPYNQDWEDPEKTVTLLEALGAKLAVCKLSWKDIEEKKGNFSEEGWRAYDEIVNKLTNSGIDVMCLVAITPPWAIDPALSPENWKGKKFNPPPKNPKDLADFASVAVKRYKNKVKTWAFFNAPQNKNHWIEPSHLADLYKATYEAVKKEQPDGTIVMPGLEGSMKKRGAYLEMFLKAGGGKYVDMYDSHMLLNEPPFTGIESSTITLQEIFKKFGEDKKPFQYGAIGWPSSFNPPARWQENKTSKGWKSLDYAPLNPEAQASRLVITMVLGRSLGVERIFWTRTRDHAPQSGAEHQKYIEKIKGKNQKWKVESESQRTMGIIDYDYQTKPSYQAFKTLIEKLDGANFIRSMDMGNGGKGCMFKKGTTFTGVFWAWEGERTIELSSNAKTVEVLDIYGKNVKTIPVVEGKFTLNVTNIPIYIEGDIEDIKIDSLHS
ncbi:MAG TPA: hypothetical protein ACFYD6_04275 [Candidatus Brocadiia bacterium]|nr:family 1 glycosylhydrolase [Candidatus Brocadiales bacterium]